MFTRTRKFKDTRLGELTFSNGEWHSAPLPTASGNLYVSIAGSDQTPDEIALTAARNFIDAPAEIIASAMRFALNDSETVDFMKNAGELRADGAFLSIQPGTFEIMLSLSGWDDAAILVRFVNQTPVSVELSD